MKQDRINTHNKARKLKHTQTDEKKTNTHKRAKTITRSTTELDKKKKQP